MEIRDSKIGTVIETEGFVILFGNRHADAAAVGEQFPNLKLKRIKQVHGNQIIHTSPQAIDFSREADAHYTNDRGVALGIATADCIPVMIYNDNPKWIVSIHAGWRGIENRIVPKSISHLIRQGCKAENLHVFAGPHIQKPSFEVGNDVKDKLLASADGARRDNQSWSALAGDKSLVDLHLILKLQLQESKIDAHNCHFELKDTVTDKSYHSFRRDKQDSGRQLSFIALK